MNRLWCILAVVVVAVALASGASAQSPLVRHGDPVPRDVRELYDAGCRFLVSKQDASGSWPDNQQGPGVDGMALMVLLASGEDPNFGAYRTPIRRALRSIIRYQDATTGYYGGSRNGNSSMYHHGFAMLAVAEAYGVVDDRTLWTEDGGDGKGRSLGQSLELAVKLAVDSAKANPLGAWRYMPQSTDADTSVSGAVFMGLLAARNAGIDVPQETIDRAIRYYVSVTNAQGQVGYSSVGGGTDATTSIGGLVMAIAHRKELPQYQKILARMIERSRADDTRNHYGAYTDYYQAQALFQADFDVWRQWNEKLVQQLKARRQADGGFAAPHSGIGSPIVETSLSLLSIAINYRFLPVYER